MSKKQVVDIVNDRIMAQLAISLMKGEPAPWQKPWITVPKQSIGGHHYRGINRVLLSWDDEDIYISAKQIGKKGGKTIEGAESRLVVFWNTFKKEVENRNGEIEEQEIPFMRYYLVYRLKDVEGIDRPSIDGEKENKRFDNIESFIESTGITIKHGGSKAFYSPSTDEITIPDISRFSNSDRYYETLLHEIAHATSHESRLNRKIGDNPKDYAREELLAEIASSYMCYTFGIDVTKFSAQYIQHWMQKIEGDKQLITFASGRAEKVLQFLNLVETPEYKKKEKAS